MHGDNKGGTTGNVKFDRLFSSSWGIFVYFLRLSMRYFKRQLDRVSFWLIALNLTSKNILVYETSKII